MIDKDIVWNNYYSDTSSRQKDSSGAWIDYAEYGNEASSYGWQVDHIVPKSKLQEAGVSEEFIDAPINLRPMQWENNSSKGNNYPTFETSVMAEGEINVHRVQSRKIIDTYQHALRDFYLENCQIDIDQL